MARLSIVSSDWHVIDGSPEEPCDRQKVERLVSVALERQVAEVIAAGDIIDVTRGGEEIIPDAAAYLGEVVGRPLAAARIPFTYVLGNHDWIGQRTSLIAQALYQNGFDPSLFTVTTGPVIRGRWQIEHGSRLDPSCDSEHWQARIGEVFTRLDYWLDHVGVNLEEINPLEWEPPADAVPAIDLPFHQRAMRWAAATGTKLIIGHSHIVADVGGRVGGSDWRLLDCGAAVKGAPFSFAWISDEGEGGVEIELIG